MVCKVDSSFERDHDEVGGDWAAIRVHWTGAFLERCLQLRKRRIHLVHHISQILILNRYQIPLRLHIGLLHLLKHLCLLSFWNSAKSNGIPRHANSEALLQPTTLTSIAIISQNQAIFDTCACSIRDFLLDRSTEEALASFTRKNPVMKTAGLVRTHLTQNRAPSGCGSVLVFGDGRGAFQRSMLTVLIVICRGNHQRLNGGHVEGVDASGGLWGYQRSR